MQNSSAFCRTQQASHTLRANESLLANVRAVATSAAAAWGIEAQSAERREERHAKRHTDATPVLIIAEERSFSENPDRGFSDQF
jgi:septal ring factor EnvC (AmiA/AmiB activator)